MPTSLEHAVITVVQRLVLHSKSDPELRQQLRQLAMTLLEETEELPKPLPVEEPMPAAAIEKLETAVASEAAPAESIPELISRLTLGRAGPNTAETKVVYPEQRSVAEDLALIEARCRLKAEGSRWAATRRRKLATGANFFLDIDPVNRDIIRRAKELPNCFLWMCHPTGPTPSDLTLIEDVGGCFEALADSIALVRQIQGETEVVHAEFEEALDLMAEAQSALRVAIAAIDGPTDNDQTKAFQWLRATSTEQQIFIQNYMRLDRSADPTRWPGILSRIQDVTRRVEETRRKRSQSKRLMGKLRHKISVVFKEPERAPAEWDSVISTACELLESGTPPSSRELRELLLPAIDLIPEQQSLPEPFQRILTEIDCYLATIPPPETPVLVQPSREIRDAADLLRGKSLVLIGGEKRQGAYRAIKDSLELKNLIWIATRAHESVNSFAPFVARPDVAVVVVAIRWSSHSYGEVKTFCDAHNKPLVRLPAGYNPNQLAAQILAQASQRLR
jgi:hypothetical protein